MRPKDILSNQDHILNQFVGIKRMAPYREREFEPREPFHHWVQRKAERGQLRTTSSKRPSSRLGHDRDHAAGSEDHRASTSRTASSSSSSSSSRRQKKRQDLNERAQIATTIVEDKGGALGDDASSGKTKRGKRNKVKGKLSKKDKKAKRKAKRKASSNSDDDQDGNGQRSSSSGKRKRSSSTSSRSKKRR
jgi:KRI1-like family C-terminal